jgi:hypothetical protein
VERRPILQALGSALAADDPLAPADAIVMTVDAGAAGVLEVADLVRQRIAPRVAVFGAEPDATEREFRRRGVPYEDEAAIAIRQLASLGVTGVERIPTPVNGSGSEGQVLPGWCGTRGYRSIVVVTSADHARRVGRILRREVQSRGLRVLIRGARYSGFDPQTWWQTRDGARIGIVEMEKLLLDWLRHPLPS